MPSDTTLLPIDSTSSSYHTVAVGSSGKGKNLLPDNSELTIDLADKAFAMIGGDHFQVDANLSVSNPKGLQAYGLFQSMLLMAYREGQASIQNNTQLPANANISNMPFWSEQATALTQSLAAHSDELVRHYLRTASIPDIARLASPDFQRQPTEVRQTIVAVAALPKT